jgi:sugar phosphate isomerase/epimerase
VNSLGALEKPREVVALLGPHTINVHVKDFEIRRVDTMMGYLVTGCAAGEGRLDIAWLVGELREHGRDPNLILELWPPYAGSIEQTNSSSGPRRTALHSRWLCVVVSSWLLLPVNPMSQLRSGFR